MKSVSFSIRLPAAAREALIEAAKAEQRSAAWIAQRAVLAWLEAHKPAPPPKAKVTK
jgi:predicted transcriptional regulator